MFRWFSCFVEVSMTIIYSRTRVPDGGSSSTGGFCTAPTVIAPPGWPRTCRAASFAAFFAASASFLAFFSASDDIGTEFKAVVFARRAEEVARSIDRP